MVLNLLMSNIALHIIFVIINLNENQIFHVVLSPLQFFLGGVSSERYREDTKML